MVSTQIKSKIRIDKDMAPSHYLGQDRQRAKCDMHTHLSHTSDATKYFWQSQQIYTMGNNFFVVLDLFYILMPYSITPYFLLPYFHVSNNALCST